MKTVKPIAGALLLIFSAYGIVHGMRAGLAQHAYAQAKYGSLKDNADVVLGRCKSAHTLYPYNYYLCMFTARTAFIDRFTSEGAEMPGRMDDSSFWCEKGLELNPYKIELRLLKTRILQRDSLKDAISYWGDYVDWHYWSPGNHALLVELYAEDGNFSKAMQSLRLIKGTVYHKQASDKLNTAWLKEKDMIKSL